MPSITLWGIYPEYIVASWIKEQKIPEGVYFVPNNWSAKYYWKDNEGIMVKILLNKNYVKQISALEFITKTEIRNFKIEIINS